MRLEADYTVINPEAYAGEHQLDKGLEQYNTFIAAEMIKHGDADAMVCGMNGYYQSHLNHVLNKIGLKKRYISNSRIKRIDSETGRTVYL